jgi:hypothetical protein
MKLPACVLLVLAACEPATPKTCEQPVASDPIVLDEPQQEPLRVAPAAAPRFPQTQPQPQPVPPPKKVQPKPKPQTTALVCGHEVPVSGSNDRMTMVRCGRG